MNPGQATEPGSLSKTFRAGDAPQSGLAMAGFPQSGLAMAMAGFPRSGLAMAGFPRFGRTRWRMPAGPGEPSPASKHDHGALLNPATGQRPSHPRRTTEQAPMRR